MKDFIFTDPADSTSQVVFRTSLIDGSNYGLNFTVFQITGLENISTNQTKKKALLNFKRIVYTIKDLVDFAILWELDLVMQDSDGSNQIILVNDDSDSDASSW